MRQLDEIMYAILHHSGSDIPGHDNLDIIRGWHLKRGFDLEGYHFFVRQNGTIEIGRPILMQGAGVYGHNKKSVHICLSGKNSFSNAQYNAAAKICVNLVTIFSCQIKLHKFFAKTECPNFDVYEIESRVSRIINTVERIERSWS